MASECNVPCTDETLVFNLETATNMLCQRKDVIQYGQCYQSEINVELAEWEFDVQMYSKGDRLYWRR